ncbi:hypothetical protein COU60_04865, partial [Candidatus Pacearchaeota archaeon CG10_big_fil_rev_8_21_14_0_10_34_76]
NAEDNDEYNPRGEFNSSLSQYGITWTFSEEVEYGTFANGDYWVVGPVTITSITPDFDGSHHGWTVNYKTTKQQPFDSRAGPLYNSSLVPVLPYSAQSGESIIKSISLEPLNDSGCRPCLQTAAVLTVLESVPANAGLTVFRPPFFGNSKPMYSTLEIDKNVLLSLEPPEGYSSESFPWIVDRFRRVQLDISSYPGEQVRPYDNYNRSNSYRGYGGRVAVDNGDAVLRFMLNDTYEDKFPQLVYYMQMGIDIYHIMDNGGVWFPNGGHGSGRKTPIIFTALLLNNQTWKNDVMNAPKMTFQEDGFLTFHQQANNGAGTVLFGEGTSWYWRALATDSASRTLADPYGYIDGGVVPGTSYQKGINSLIWKGPVLMNQLLPEARIIWNNELFEDYVNRWVNLGAWAQPDICAPVMGYCVGGANDGNVCTYANKDFCLDGHCAGAQCDGGDYDGQLCGIGYGPSPDNNCGGGGVRCQRLIPEFYKVTYGEDPNNLSACILDNDSSDGIGRFPYRHGQDNNTGGAGYISAFAEAMWNKYRLSPPECRDFIDNDGDGLIDYGLDPECLSYDDNTENSTDEEATYYVSTIGNDGNFGTISQPWKTLQHAADVVQPGDTVLVRGGVYRDVGVEDNRGKITVRFKSSGLPGQPITFKAYPGEKPVLDGSDVISGWQKCTSQAECANIANWQNIYQVEVPGGYRADNAMLLDDDRWTIVSADPEPYDPLYYVNAQDNWYDVPQTDYNETSFVDPLVFNQQDSSYWDEGYVMIWGCNNNVHISPIRGFVPGENRIYYDRITCNVSQYGEGDKYRLWNHWSILNQSGEYFVESSTGRIYYWPLNVVPGETKISIRQKGFDIRGKDYYVIDGFTFTGYSGAASAVTNYNFGTGYTGTDLVIQNNVIYNMDASPINIAGINNTLVSNNIIYNTTGGRGIHLSGGYNQRIENNWLRRVSGTALVFYGAKGGRIYNNTVIDSNGPHANGITTYLETEDVAITNNTVINSNIAYTAQNSRRLLVEGNIFRIDNGGYCLAAWPTSSDSYDLVIKNNLLLGCTPTINADWSDVHEYNNIFPRADHVSHVTHSNNILYNEPSGYYQGDYNESVEPNIYKLFVDPDHGDYRLLGLDRVGDPLVDVCTMGIDGGHVGPFDCAGCLDDNPIALLSPSITSGYEDLEVIFDASASMTCTNGSDIIDYRWDFGDGYITNGPNLDEMTRVFSAGLYIVNLTVTDSVGRKDSTIVEIKVLPSAEPNLILYYNFDGNVDDFSGRAPLRNGEWQRNLSSGMEPYDGEYVNGISGQAGVFPATYIENVKVPNVEELRGMNELTISVWAKKAIVPWTGNVLGKYGHYGIRFDDNDVVFGVSTTGGDSGSITGNDIADGGWHHYAFTYDGSEMRAFVDGVVIGNDSANGTVKDETYDSWAYRVGSAGLGGYDPLNGSIDELKMYDRALSDGEIDIIFRNGGGAPIGDLNYSPENEESSWARLMSNLKKILGFSIEEI